MVFKNKRKNYNLIMALTLVEDSFQFASVSPVKTTSY